MPRRSALAMASLNKAANLFAVARPMWISLFSYPSSCSLISSTVILPLKRMKEASSCAPSIFSRAMLNVFILSAPRGVRVEEPGFCPAGGQAPDAAERLANVLALVLAYALFLAAAALTLSAFFVGRPAAALVAIAAGAVACWLVQAGEVALDAQALHEFEAQFME